MNFDFKEIVAQLNSGAVILYPSDTIWGLGCDATNDDAVNKLLTIKGKNEGNGLIVLVDSDRLLNNYVEEVPAIAWDIIDQSEEPISIVYPKGRNLAKEVLAEDGSVAVRYTKDPFCSRIIQALRRPLVSTSANFKGKSSPKSFANIDAELLKRVDYIVDRDPKEKTITKASSIIKLGLGGEIQILRD